MGNKWSNRRYDQPGASESVGEPGIEATQVAIKYDLAEPAPEPGVANQLLRNPTDPLIPSCHGSVEIGKPSVLR